MDLTIIEEKYLDVIDKVDRVFSKSNISLTKIASRGLSDLNNFLEFKVFDNDKLERLSSDLRYQDIIQNSFGRSNNQIDNKLMTLTMEAGCAPAEIIKQCVAQIESKRSALETNKNKIYEQKINLSKYKKEIVLLDKKIHILTNNKTDNELDNINTELEIIELEARIDYLKNKMVELVGSINSSIVYIEGCLKEIASFNEVYISICEKLGWEPDNWSETDLMELDLKGKIRKGFTQSYYDIISSGVIGNGTLHWLYGLGINPQVATRLVNDFISLEKEEMEKAANPFPYSENENEKKYSDVYNVTFNNYGLYCGKINKMPNSDNISIIPPYNKVSINNKKHSISEIIVDKDYNIILFKLDDNELTIEIDNIVEKEFLVLPNFINNELLENWLNTIENIFITNFFNNISKMGLGQLINEEFVFLNK
jgi:hypothetical protein